MEILVEQFSFQERDASLNQHWPTIIMFSAWTDDAASNFLCHGSLKVLAYLHKQTINRKVTLAVQNLQILEAKPWLYLTFNVW